MARFLFVTWDGGGNLPPEIGVAEELRARGHDVGFAGYETQRARIEAGGFQLLKLPRSGALDLDALAFPEHREALLGKVMANPDHLADLSELVARTRPDLLVVDCMMFGALASAERLGLPHVTFLHLSPAAWEGRDGRQRRAPMVPAINAAREAAGLPPVADVGEAWAGGAAVVTTVRSMDPGPRPDGWRYVGPVLPATARSHAWTSPWLESDPGLLIVVSLSTTAHFGDQAPRLQAVLDALAGERARVLVTTGPAVDPGRLAVPANAAVRDYVPHSAALRGAALAVSHGGHGTVMTALAAGVPLLCLPNPMADQPFNATRIAELGAGLCLAPDSSPATIREAARTVLATAAYRAAASRIAAEIAACPGAAGAAEELERMAQPSVSAR